MIILLVLLIAFLWLAVPSAMLYGFMEIAYKNDFCVILPAPKTKKQYYTLQFTWGILMNIAGILVASVLRALGKKPVKYGWNYYFELPVHFGLSLGIFVICPINGSTHTKNHEHGHSIQNIYFGPFMVGAVSIPSAARFWIRRWKEAKGEKLTTGYDDIWFEGQATQTGDYFIDNEPEM